MARLTRTQRAGWWSKVGRDLILFGLGCGLTVHDALGSGPERPSLYVLYAGMMGFGPVLRYAESRQNARNREADE